MSLFGSRRFRFGDSVWGLLFVVGASLLKGCVPAQAQAPTEWTLTSPEGEVRATVRHQPDENGTLAYRVTVRDDGEEAVLVPFSPLGIVRADADFTTGLRLVSQTERRIDEAYTLVHGKRARVHAEAHERTLTFANQAGNKVELIVRAYNEGVALRYRFPALRAREHTVWRERTGFRVPAGGTGWFLPYDPPTKKYAPAYENSFRRVRPDTSSPTGVGWGFPALFRAEEGGPWGLVTDAGLGRNYAGMHFALDTSATRTSTGGPYRFVFPEPGEGNGEGDVHPSSTLPWATSWRVIVAGSDLGDIVESSLVTHVSRPSTLTDTSWIRPGVASWSWWSDGSSPTDPSDLRSFVDLAADMSWRYSLVDLNWTVLPNDTVRALANYADDRGVGLFFWYNSGGPHTTIQGAPRDRVYTPEQRMETFQRLHDLGAAGVKIDFFQSDKQERIRHYLAILEDAAQAELLVNVHGSTIPRGWHRTYPNLVTMEAVRGAEFYKGHEDYPELAPRHNTILPFTRNVLGPMDYTPVTFTDAQYPHRTTDAHELALSVVFQSGLQHFADRVSGYRGLPPAPKTFLKQVPTSWDDIHFVDGFPGRYIVLARRSGEAWYVGGIAGEDEHAAAVDFSFLPEETTYEATVIQDGSGDASFSTTRRRVEANVEDMIQLPPRGGFVMRLVPTNR